MSRFIDVRFSPPRTYVLGRRVHHGLAGLLLGVVLMGTDWHDRRCWITDFVRHPNARER